MYRIKNQIKLPSVYIRNKSIKRSQYVMIMKNKFLIIVIINIFKIAKMMMMISFMRHYLFMKRQ